MRIKINHINMGLCHETFFVCSEARFDYFKDVAAVLEYNYGVKAGIYVYDRDELTPKVRRQLGRSYYVLFMLEPGVTEAAVANPAHPFRQVYAYVNRANPYAVSLVAVDGCQVDYNLQYPEEMKSYYWLHRKNFFISTQSEAETARQFYEEFRRTYSKAQNRRLEKLTTEGVQGTRTINSKVLKLLYVLAFVLACQPFILHLLVKDDPTTGWMFLLLLFVVAAICLGMYSLCQWLYLRNRLLDVSTVFADFQKTTAARLRVVGTFYLACFLAMIAMNVAIQLEIEHNHVLVFYLLWSPAMALCITHIIRNLVIRKLTYRSGYYIRLVERCFLPRLIFTGVTVLLLVAGIIVVASFMLAGTTVSIAI